MGPGVGDALNHSTLFLSITKRGWEKLFNLLALILFTNLFVFCEKKSIKIVIFQVLIQIF